MYSSSKNVFFAMLGFFMATGSSAVGVHKYQKKQLEFVDQQIAAQKALKPSEVLIVLDVDGTLTDHSSPDAENPTHGGALKPRGKAAEYVGRWIAKKYNVVVASAWKPFPDTLDRLKHLNLGGALGINGNGTCTPDQKLDFKNGKSASVESCHVGLVASARNTTLKEKWFRQKAFTYAIAHPGLDQKTLKYVIFADDSAGNIKYFEDDMAKMELFKNADVDLVELTSANAQPDLK